ncbi:MAG: HAD-IIB family hydrolase [Pseudomonadota bacterium]
MRQRSLSLSENWENDDVIAPSTTLVATDLDGTLLDHETYSWEPAKPALAFLDAHAVPVVFVTSKTAAELTMLRQEIGNTHPFIVENGSAIIIPKGYFENMQDERIVLGADYENIRSFLISARAEGFAFKGFADMTVQDIADCTGLDAKSAQAAGKRLASEPMIWHGDEAQKQTFMCHAENRGFRVMQGGRFLTIGGQTDKGAALKTLLDTFRTNGQAIATVIALGDSGNDVALLQAATHPVWVRKHGATPDCPFMANARCTLAHGPTGWADAIGELMGVKTGMTAP